MTGLRKRMYVVMKYSDMSFMSLILFFSFAAFFFFIRLLRPINLFAYFPMKSLFVTGDKKGS